jgi:hypothetical protein
MIRKIASLLAIPALALTMAGCEASAFVDFGFQLSFGTGGDFTSGGNASTRQKQLEVNVSIDPGSTGSGDITYDINMVQKWSSRDPQAPAGDETIRQELIDGTNGSFDRDVTYQPVFAELNSSTGKIDARFVVTLQYGWNEFKIGGTVTGEDAKGNQNVKTIDEPATYIFGDFGDTIPLKLALEWNKATSSPGADLDLIIRETSGGYDRWIFWGDMGYDLAACVSSPDGVAPPAVNTACYQREQYVTGKDRTTAATYGSLDKDDIARGGPEIYTIDPQAAVDASSNRVIRADYAIGDTFEIYVGYYEDQSAGGGTAGQDAVGVLSAYVAGVDTPVCAKTAAITEDKIEGPTAGSVPTATEFVAALGGALKHMGTFSIVDDGGGNPIPGAFVPGVDAQLATVNGTFCDE